MKTGRIIVAAIMMLIATTQVIESKSQWDETIRQTSELPETAVKLNESKERTPFSPTDGTNSGSSNGPYKAPPTDAGDGQKLPVRGGFWILAGLALAYGFSRRVNIRKEK